MSTILITGASTGIGRATALHFLKKGWYVAATMRKPETADWAPQDPRLLVLRLDVTDAASIAEAVASVKERFGGIDALVNNAGYGLVGPFEASSSEQVRRQFETNVFGLMDVTRAALPALRESRGVIVNISSVGGRVTFPLYSLYHSTKCAVEGFSESLQFELQPLGVRVKLIEPGPIRTDFYDRSPDVIENPSVTAYAAYVKRMLPKLQGSGADAPGPEVVALTIERAVHDRSEKMRYPVNANLVYLRRLIPERLFVSLVRMVLSR
jgi:NAD(P)-dependent dehydrogenase (short-subunit alcohol dehydrogenase family)